MPALCCVRLHSCSNRLSTIYRTTIASLQSPKWFSSTCRKRQKSVLHDLSPKESAVREPKLSEDKFIYKGPLAKSFRNLKIFSLSSVGLTAGLAPILFVIESGLPMSARVSLAAIALGTSGLSTALISWCAKPYVTTMRRFKPEKSGSAELLEMTTQSLFLKPLTTKVYDPSFLIETRRPFAQWELTKEIHLTSNRTESVGTNVHPEDGTEETVAETSTEDGTIVGRWVVKWGSDGVGTCHQLGHVVRYFNVHEELLQ